MLPGSPDTGEDRQAARPRGARGVMTKWHVVSSVGPGDRKGT